MAPYWRSPKPNIPRREAESYLRFPWLLILLAAVFLFGMGTWRAVHLLSLTGAFGVGIAVGFLTGRFGR